MHGAPHRRLGEDDGERLDFAGDGAVDESTGLLGQSIGLDSVEVLQLVSAIEEAWSLTIEDEELKREHFATLGTVIAVVGAPSGHGDDLVRCVIVTSEPCTPDEIVSHCATRIADYKVPSRIEFREGLPRSETGKLLRHEL